MLCIYVLQLTCTSSSNYILHIILRSPNLRLHYLPTKEPIISPLLWIHITPSSEMVQRYLKVTHRIHGTGIFTYIYDQNQPKVGKYTIHGWHGWWRIWRGGIISTYSHTVSLRSCTNWEVTTLPLVVVYVARYIYTSHLHKICWICRKYHPQLISKKAIYMSLHRCICKS